MASYSISNITDSSVKVKVSGLSTDYSYKIRFFVRLADDTSDTTYDETVSVMFTTSYTETISGLEPNTDYKINVDVGEGWLGAKSFTTEGIEEDEKPNTFSWTYAKTSGDGFNLTAVEWNNFTARINAERKYLGKSAYSFTKAVKGENFTAAMYNEAVDAIKGMGGGAGGYIYTVKKGDTITEYAMNQIVAELNSAIKNL